MTDITKFLKNNFYLISLCLSNLNLFNAEDQFFNLKYSFFRPLNSTYQDGRTTCLQPLAMLVHTYSLL